MKRQSTWINQPSATDAAPAPAALGFEDNDEDDGLGFKAQLLTTRPIGFKMESLNNQLTVIELDVGGQAALAGVQVGMQLKTIDNQYLFNLQEWNDLLQYRQNKVNVVMVMSKDVPHKDPLIAQREILENDAHVFTIDVSLPLGMAIDHPKADQSHYPAVITKIQPGAQAANKGVLVGMHIHTVNGAPCRDKKLAFVLNLVRLAKQHTKLNFIFEHEPDAQETHHQHHQHHPHHQHQHGGKKAAVKKTKKKTKEIMTGMFKKGPLGITWERPWATIKKKTKHSQADQIPGLKKGALLVQIGTINVRNKTFNELAPILKRAQRPVRLVFEDEYDENAKHHHHHHHPGKLAGGAGGSAGGMGAFQWPDKKSSSTSR